MGKLNTINKEILKSRENILAEIKKIQEDEQEEIAREEDAEIEYCISLIKKIFTVSDETTSITKKDFTIWIIEFYLEERNSSVQISERWAELKNWPFKLKETREIRKSIMALEGLIRYMSAKALEDVFYYFEDSEGFSVKRMEKSFQIGIDRTVFEKKEASE